MKEDITDRFWSKVCIKLDNECWEWKAGKVRGYGQFSYHGNNAYAHRVAWEIVNGSIPNGLLVLHKCDNKACVNPSHLYCGTHSDNMGDREWRNPLNGSPPRFYAGEVWLIRKLKKSGISTTMISRMFKCSRITIDRYTKFGKSDYKQLVKEGYYI